MIQTTERPTRKWTEIGNLLKNTNNADRLEDTSHQTQKATHTMGERRERASCREHRGQAQQARTKIDEAQQQLYDAREGTKMSGMFVEAQNNEKEIAEDTPDSEALENQHAFGKPGLRLLPAFRVLVQDQ